MHVLRHSLNVYPKSTPWHVSQNHPQTESPYGFINPAQIKHFLSFTQLPSKTKHPGGVAKKSPLNWNAWGYFVKLTPKWNTPEQVRKHPKTNMPYGLKPPPKWKPLRGLYQPILKCNTSRSVSQNYLPRTRHSRGCYAKPSAKNTPKGTVSQKHLSIKETSKGLFCETIYQNEVPPQNAS